ncbi:MAG: alginate export family protein [Acidobacteria bacterium]|nr:alginate export family protein [Acidobacteriota bacterium]
MDGRVGRGIFGRIACGIGTAMLGLAAIAVPRASAQTGTPSTPVPPPLPTWRLSAINTARAESWRYFEPRPGGGDPDYAYLGDRLRVDVRGHWAKVDLTLAVQHVGFIGLPEGAAGPGPLGLGPLYFDQGGRRSNSSQVYLRFANLRFPAVVNGVDLQVGRMGYTSGAEAPSGVPKIETVKRQRLDARIVGEFEWSIYQRVFDGVRVDVTQPKWRATGVALMPTQGGFARQANTTMRDVVVAGATLSSRPAAGPGRHTQVQGFGWQYRDRRSVTQRPDNSGRQAPAGVAIDVTTAGAVVLGAYPAGAGEADLFAWGVAQTGDWYGDDHRAFALALEGGYQWTAAPWRPWLRAGLFHASGDRDPADDSHGTFFPMLPTVRRFSQTTAYSTMNLRDLFAQVQARPRAALGLRLDLRRIDLASAADLWYAGSGATLARGTTFGYAGRRSNGSTRLGTAIEASADYAVAPRLSVNGFLGHLRGGPVVTGTFGGRDLWFAYLESVVTLGPR